VLHKYGRTTIFVQIRKNLLFMHSLRTSLLQADLVWEDPQANRYWYDQQLSRLAGQTDLVVLPEMFTTGFSMRPAALAEPMEGPTLAWMRQWAARLDAALTGSLIIAEGLHYYNRLLWVQPDGSYEYYDKRHCFSLAGEHEHYQAGERRLVVSYRGWRIMPLICYDLRFPVWSRNDLDYDLLIYVANFPDRRGHAWRSLLTARAIENQAYVLAVNRVGMDGHDLYHAGDSSVIDYEGRLLHRISHQAGVLTASLVREELLQFRQRFNFLADRDYFSLHP
jgi:omega-amidase